VKNQVCFLMRWPSIALLFLCIPASSLPQTPHFDPAGIPGTMLVCGGGMVSEAALDRFIELAGGAKAKVAVVDVNDFAAAKAVQEGLAKSAKKKDAAEPRYFVWDDARAALPDLSGVWLITTFDHRKWQNRKAQEQEKDYRAVLQRGGVVATSGYSSDIVGDRGLLLLPVYDIRRRADDQKKDADLTGMVVMNVGEGAALLIQRRTMSAVGPGATTLSILGKNGPARATKLQGKAQEDLTAWRRSARDLVEGFPPKQPQSPVLEKGTLVIVGGGGMPSGLFKKFVEYAGGEGKANIVIFPTAAPDPLPKRDKIAADFMKAGAKKATLLYAQKRPEVESKEFLDTLRGATGLWFDGGRQWRFVDCYENTKALPLMFDVLMRGGVIGGTSAGATIQGDYLCRGGVFHNFDIRYEGYQRGLGFLKGVAIDQHFSQRKRHADMSSLMKTYPQYLGIGLDEATAIVVKGQVAEVIGKGKAHFYDANRKVEKDQPDYEALAEPGRYDLKDRKILPAQNSGVRDQGSEVSR
jgi:cyanophycinase